MSLKKDARAVEDNSQHLLSLQLHTIGGVVEPAKPIMIIVPEDAGFVEEGQEAAVNPDAFPFTRYGTLIGQALTISNDAVEQQSDSYQPPRLIYTTRIRLEKRHHECGW